MTLVDVSVCVLVTAIVIDVNSEIVVEIVVESEPVACAVDVLVWLTVIVIVVLGRITEGEIPQHKQAVA